MATGLADCNSGIAPLMMAAMTRRRSATVQRIAGLCLLLAAFGACSADAPAAQIAAERWAAAWIGALNSQRLEQLLPLLTPDAEYEDPLVFGPRSGPRLAYSLSAWLERFPHLRFEITTVARRDDTVMVEWRAFGVVIGRPVLGVFVIEPAGSKIRKVRGHFDPRPFIRFAQEPRQAGS